MAASAVSSRLQIKRPGRARARIGLTSLIDVIFILLIFFMLATRFEVWQALDVSAGKAGAAPSETRPLHVKIHPGGAFEIDGARLDGNAFSLRLKSEGKDHLPPVFLEPASGARLADLMYGAEIVRGAGGQTLSFVDPQGQENGGVK